MFLHTDTRENLQLDAIEELLCSAFQSKHRDIVNYTAVMWNRAFENTEEIQYPEKLKNVLISIHSYVDVVLPGVDLSSYASSEQEPSFIESQGNSEIVNPSLDKQDHRKTPLAKRPSSRRSTTPRSVQLSLPSKQGLTITPNKSRPKSARRSATPKLRHDSSQIQFAPIESSPSRDSMESQFLTDRQKEVRERQRENAVIFAHIRASTENPISNEAEDSKQERDATPQRNQDLEDYVTSTPTPRRGQAPMIDFDHEMTDDIPSSPPEPRRNLLAEMKPRTRSSSVFQDFPILSSPISGSPATKRQTAPADESHLEQGDAGNGEDVSEAVKEERPDQAAGSQPERISTSVENKSVQVNTRRRPTTPRKTRSGKILDSSPKSDPEVFVDALTSPASRSPRALRSNTSKGVQTVQNLPSSSPSKDRSFELSDDEERSLARLVIELDSRKCEPALKYDSESPEKPRELGDQSSECITVSTGSKKSCDKSKSKEDESNQSPPIIPSSTEAGSSHSPTKRSKRKRKRYSDRSQEPGSSQKKKRQHKDTDDESVPNSQVSQNIEGDTTEINTEVDTSMELDTNIAFSSQDLARQEPAAVEAVQRSSSPVDFNDSLVERESDTEAVTLQIITEASQQSEVEPIPTEVLEDDIPLVDDDTKMVDQEEEGDAEKAAEFQVEQPRPVEEAAVEKSAADRIMDALKGGLEGLRTATLTRDEVSRIEDMFFDIKKELYQAESRGRC